MEVDSAGRIGMAVRIKAVSVPFLGKCMLDIICGSSSEKTGICHDGDSQWVGEYR